MKRSFRTIIFLVGIVMITAAWLIVSWGRYPDCVIDFGRELYVPWQLAQGKILYTDMFFYYGPLAQYFHAFLFKCFGPSLAILIAANFIILLSVAYLLFLLFKFSKGSLSGLIAVGIFVGIFAFGRYIPMGNFNYICPYSHELVDGFALSLLGLLIIGYWLKSPKSIHLVGIGLLTGLIFLTKIEILFAFVGALSAAFILNAMHKQSSPASIIKDLLIIIFFMLIPPGIFLGYMSSVTTFDQAVRAVVGPFVMVKGMSQAAGYFYKHMAGLDDRRINLTIALKTAVKYVLTAFVIGALSWAICRIKDRRMQGVVTGVLSCAVILVATCLGGKNSSVFRGVPVVLFFLIVIQVYRFWKRLCLNEDVPRKIFQIVLAVYALLLMLKILLSVEASSYGFVLTLPGTILVGLLLVNEAACWARGRFYRPWVFRVLATACLAGVVVYHFHWSQGLYQTINYPLGQGWNSFLAEDPPAKANRSVVINNVVQWLDKNTSPQDSVIAMPEGVMINYLCRRVNPIPVYEFVPSMVQLLGEDKIIHMLTQSAPDYIVLVPRDMHEFGGQRFGTDYGIKIYQWIRAHYEVKVFWGKSPDLNLGVIMKKR